MSAAEPARGIDVDRRPVTQPGLWDHCSTCRRPLIWVNGHLACPGVYCPGHARPPRTERTK